MAGPDSVPTVLFDDQKMLSPVDTPEDLPPVFEAREGHMCFVTEENRFFEFRDGEWRGSVGADDGSDESRDD